MSRLVDTDEYQDSIRQKHPSWPHWYKNEPYYPRRPRPGAELSDWQYSQRPTRPPDPRHISRPPDRATQSSCVLILMRGLPGSGKSTLARYRICVLS
uniref:NEDD4 binding protein 2-like 1 n=1 Tax=Sphaeramia orbicularis TaxID=375764 RepID=A0A673C2E9_9TELE